MARLLGTMILICVNELAGPTERHEPGVGTANAASDRPAGRGWRVAANGLPTVAGHAHSTGITRPGTPGRRGVTLRCPAPRFLRGTSAGPVAPNHRFPRKDHA